MVDSPTAEQWARLRTSRPEAEDALGVLPIVVEGRDAGIRMAVDSAGTLHLLLPSDLTQREEHLPDLNGLRVRSRQLQNGAFLDLSAPPSHESVFTPFCREIVQAVAVEGRHPTKAVAATIRAWQSAWKPVRPSMDKTTQVGLFGELSVLRLLMIPSIGAEAVSRWSGPDHERHDFVGNYVHVEVKTTRRSRAEHEISRLDQLRVPAGRKLLFVSVQVEETIGGSESVASELDAITDLLRNESASLDEFLTKRVKVGWSEDMRPSGDLLRFFVRSAEVYEVDAQFPRLPDAFDLPSGVVSIRYTIDLANLPTLSLAEAIGVIAADAGRAKNVEARE